MPSIELYFGEQDLGKYRLVKDRTTVGRDPTADIVIDNLGISRIHCAFVKRDNIYAVEDNNSSNGTFVNGQRISSHNLNEGDEVVIGKYRMIFHYHSEEGKVADNGVQAVATGEGVMPDTLKTYVMDGKAIREQLRQMEAAADGASEVSAADYAAMMDPLKPRTPLTQRAEKGKSNLLPVLYLSLFVNLLLLTALVVLGILFFVYVMPIIQHNKPQGKPAPAAAAPEKPSSTASEDITIEETSQQEAPSEPGEISVDDLLSQ